MARKPGTRKRRRHAGDWIRLPDNARRRLRGLPPLPAFRWPRLHHLTRRKGTRR